MNIEIHVIGDMAPKKEPAALVETFTTSGGFTAQIWCRYDKRSDEPMYYARRNDGMLLFGGHLFQTINDVKNTILIGD